MTTKKLDLSYWLSGAIDYVPERNLVGVRTFDNSERMNTIDRQRPELVSLFPNPLLEFSSASSGSRGENSALSPLNVGQACQLLVLNQKSGFSFTNYTQQQLRSQLALQQRIKKLPKQTPQQLLSLQTQAQLETALGAEFSDPEALASASATKLPLAVRLKVQASGLFEQIKQKLSTSLNAVASLKQAEVKKNFWLNSDLAPLQVEKLSTDSLNAKSANLPLPASKAETVVVAETPSVSSNLSNTETTGGASATSLSNEAAPAPAVGKVKSVFLNYVVEDLLDFPNSRLSQDSVAQQELEQVTASKSEPDTLPASATKSDTTPTANSELNSSTKLAPDSAPNSEPKPTPVYPKLLDLAQYQQLDAAHISQIQQFQQRLPQSLRASIQQVKYITPQQSGVISLISAPPELSLSSLAMQLRQRSMAEVQSIPPKSAEQSSDAPTSAAEQAASVKAELSLPLTEFKAEGARETKQASASEEAVGADLSELNLDRDLTDMSEKLLKARYCKGLEIIDLQLVSVAEIQAIIEQDRLSLLPDSTKVASAKSSASKNSAHNTSDSAKNSPHQATTNHSDKVAELSASKAAEVPAPSVVREELTPAQVQSKISLLQQVIGEHKSISARLLNDLYVCVPTELVFYTSQWLKGCGLNLSYSLNNLGYAALLGTKARLQQQNISLGNRQQWLQQQLVQQASSYGQKYRLSQRLNFILRSSPELAPNLLSENPSKATALAVENFDFMQLGFAQSNSNSAQASLEIVQFFNHSPQIMQALNSGYGLPYANLLMNTEISGVSELKIATDEQQAWEQANKLVASLDLQQSLSQTVAHFSQVDSSQWMQEPDLRKRAKLCLEKCFGLKQYRPLQQEIIESLLAGKDTLAILATGSGKSICYQVPGLCLDGCTIVVSPLISLMKDQISQLATYGIGAASINNTTSTEEKNEIMQQIMQRKIKFLYVAPERVINEGFLRELASLPICLIAIDEAHCVSQWGHDFRPQYQRLYRIRNLFSYHIPIIAATATARVNTRSDIITSLQMQNPSIYIGDFNRDNLYLKVQKVKHKGHRDKTLQRMLDNKNRLPAIVYCYARKTVENVCEMLRKEGFRASRYHAELTHAEREKNQHDFISGKIDIMVATIAFGMGINKSDVRQVIHYDYPSTLENYYQEIGRAGRDGEPALVTLLDDEGNRDWRENMYLTEMQNTVVELAPQAQQVQQFNQDFLAGQDNIAHRDYIRNIATDTPQIERNPEFSPAMKLKKLQEVFDFCDSQNCRRRVLLSAFNQILEHDCGNCDICAHGRHKIVIKDDLRVVLGLISVFQSKVSFITLVRILSGKARPETELEICYNLAGSKIAPEQLAGLSKRIENLSNSTFTAGSEYWSALIEQLLELRCIEYDKKYSYLGITEFGYELYKQNKSIELASNPKLEKRNVYLDQLQLDLHALAIKVGEYLEVRYDAVLSDPIIRGILEKLPTNIEELKQIDGFTDRRINLIGKYVLNQVRVHKQRLSLRDPKYTPN